MEDNPLRRLWREGKPALNAWLTIPAAWTAEVMANAGFDAATIDLQHGLMGYQAAVAMLQAVSTTRVVPLARVPSNDSAAIMRLLDAGASGIVCPMVNGRGEAEGFVRACRYPPLGDRSYGPIRAALRSGGEYFAHANRTILAFAMIETAQALAELDGIASTPGLDGLYVGAVDLSIRLGLPEKVDWDAAPLRDALDRIVAAARRNDRIAGIHASSPEDAARLARLGFLLITPANDTTLLRAAAGRVLGETRRALGLA